MKCARYARAYVLSITAILLYQASSHAGEVCKRRCIVGYSAFCERAHPYQENVTRQIDHVVLYVEKAPDGTFSFASNIQSEGVEFPTKIVGFKELKDLDTVLINLDAGFKEQVEANLDILDRFHETAEVYVTADVLKPDGSSDLDFSGVKKLHVLENASGD